MSNHTRRDLLRTGAIGAGALLAGCTGNSSTETADAGDESTSTSEETATATPEDTSYSVEMAPVGSVEFEEPPQKVAHYFPGYADMAVALGHGDTVASIGTPSRYYTSYYDELPGVSVDKDSITDLIGESGIDKEIFYELDADLHMIDPVWLTSNDFFGLEQKDIEELTTNVAPFLGNSIFRRTDTWHDYRFYTLYEAFEKVAQVHQEQEKYQQFKGFHDAFLADVQTKLPPADSRPSALLVYGAGDEPESFSPYRISDKGTNKKQFHDLGITDALAGTGIEGLSESNRGKIDYETMLEVDPEVILMRAHETKTEQEFQDTVVAFMKEHPTAKELTAVQNDQVFRGGPIYAGPIHNLFLTERFATGLFPDHFEGELFDRDELAGIITG
ncbi:ABC transporter substrate-binding protein [Natronomonas sp. EA1]|uniref:ABC transporter substrate-binding protein n=1 Tax=Natronomonas sp. EA1 TaxID=3421655 RepID=UPI003EBB70C5